MIRLTPRLESAIRVAAHAHAAQTRKASDTPYIIHPYAVMLLVSEETDDEDTLVAALFHDIIEDAPHVYSERQMREEYGRRVTDIVRGVTHDDTIADWHERCRAYIANLREAPRESVMVSAADKTHNLMSTLDDYRIVGDDVWKRFRTGKTDQLWWYSSVLDVIDGRLSDSPLAARLNRLVDELRDIVPDAQPTR